MKLFDLFKKHTQTAPEGTIASTPAESASAENQADAPAAETSATPAGSAKDGEDKKKTHVHNLIIVDESGSMHSIYRSALTGMNETLRTIRTAQTEHPEQEHFVTLVTFDTSHYNSIYANTPAGCTAEITNDQYCPNGGTPLFDAMGRAINELRSIVAKGDVVLVTVITDGYENSSREYSGKAIKALIEEMKKDDWVFAYIGANQDVEVVAKAMSIDNYLEFEADEASTSEMFAKESRSRKKFFSRLDHPDCTNLNVTGSYFDE